MKPWVYRIFDLVARDGSLVVKPHNEFGIYRVIIKFYGIHDVVNIVDTFVSSGLELWLTVFSGTLQAMQLQQEQDRGEKG